MQFLSSESKAKPLSQRQRKLPIVFRHLPLEHREFIILHSFISERKNRLVHKINDDEKTLYLNSAIKIGHICAMKWKHLWIANAPQNFWNVASIVKINLGNAAIACVQTGTFEEGSAVDEVSPVRESRATRAELGVLWAALLRTLVTLGAPGYTHRAAASVHAVPAGNGCPTALVIMSEVALLCTQVWKRTTGVVKTETR